MNLGDLRAQARCGRPGVKNVAAEPADGKNQCSALSGFGKKRMKLRELDACGAMRRGRSQ
jgi:hypothetical protein